jgi:dynactin 1
MSGITPGRLISLPDGRHAIVRFVGTTHFAPGDWIGIELDEPTGKNDGSVQGERYFDCDQGYGMFIRSSAVAAILEPPRKEEPRPPPPKLRPSGADSRAKPSGSTVPGGPLGARRPSTLSASTIKRQSINAVSPSPAPRGPAAGRPLRVWSYSSYLLGSIK